MPLTDETVAGIKEKLAMPGANKAAIAREAKTSRATVYKIATGRSHRSKGVAAPALHLTPRSRILAFSCTHYPVMREGFIDFLLDIKKRWNCNRVVHCGDLVDLHSITYHEADPSLYSPGAELELAVDQMKEGIYKAFKKLDIIAGNHDMRIHRKATSCGLPYRVLQNLANIYETPKGWNWHQQYSDVDIDGVLYRHGDKGRGGERPAVLNAINMHRSVVQGHFHHALFTNWLPPNQDRLIFGMQVGCGLDGNAAAMKYGEKFNHKPALGCGIIIDGIHAYVERMVL